MNPRRDRQYSPHPVFLVRNLRVASGLTVPQPVSHPVEGSSRATRISDRVDRERFLISTNMTVSTDAWLIKSLTSEILGFPGMNNGIVCDR